VTADPGLDLAPLLAGFLVFSRVAALLMALPATGMGNVPATVRMAAALPLAAVLYPTVAGAKLPSTIPELLVSGIAEVGLGVAMGFVVGMVIGALSMASEIIGMKLGLSMASMLDPMTGVHTNPLGLIAQTLATGLFFGLNLHLHCIRAMADSLHVVPPGMILAPLAAGGVLLQVATTVLELGVRLAGPVVAFAFLVNFSLLLLGRMAPGLQVFFSIGTSFTLIVGIVVLGAALPTMMLVERDALSALWTPMQHLMEAVSHE
jgi:flagellar biosynthetic protein FliR